MKEQIIDFSLAALPWIAAGLLLAILCVRGAGKRGKKEQEDNYGAEGMSLGMCFGTAIATSLGYNTGIGLSLGMLLGLAVGSSIKREKHAEDHEKKS